MKCVLYYGNIKRKPQRTIFLRRDSLLMIRGQPVFRSFRGNYSFVIITFIYWYGISIPSLSNVSLIDSVIDHFAVQ